MFFKHTFLKNTRFSLFLKSFKTTIHTIWYSINIIVLKVVEWNRCLLEFWWVSTSESCYMRVKSMGQCQGWVLGREYLFSVGHHTSHYTLPSLSDRYILVAVSRRQSQAVGEIINWLMPCLLTGEGNKGRLGQHRQMLWLGLKELQYFSIYKLLTLTLAMKASGLI